MAIINSIGTRKEEIYEQIKNWASEMDVEASLKKAIADASTSPPADYVYQQGWVLIAFQNAL